ncbi:hypothetical protein LJC71_08455 [Desulfosarcina sp. OttesenSCG-928-A07]|nr:hypothetical protein [Desulfosarcina sp. OttesenSCG-928-G17]MDL2329756.1 hypothetical protein [Desulfosarcina sp. OttesenSCG-928-A07]
MIEMPFSHGQKKGIGGCFGVIRGKRFGERADVDPEDRNGCPWGLSSGCPA